MKRLRRHISKKKQFTDERLWFHMVKRNEHIRREFYAHVLMPCVVIHSYVRTTRMDSAPIHHRVDLPIEFMPHICIRRKEGEFVDAMPMCGMASWIGLGVLTGKCIHYVCTQYSTDGICRKSRFTQPERPALTQNLFNSIHAVGADHMDARKCGHAGALCVLDFLCDIQVFSNAFSPGQSKYWK